MTNHNHHVDLSEVSTDVARALEEDAGTGTNTARYVAAVQGTRAAILDTRKPIPGLRVAEKYAVRCGGGENHRIGLYDAILIKENHIATSGGLTAAFEAAPARARTKPVNFIQVEVETQRLAGELFNFSANLQMVPVQYKGADRAMTGRLRGQTQRNVKPLAAALPHIRSGRVNALVVPPFKRAHRLQEVPTTHEAGVAGLDVANGAGGIGADIAAKLNAALKKALVDPSAAASLQSQSISSEASSLAECFEVIARVNVRGELVNEKAGVQPE